MSGLWFRGLRFRVSGLGVKVQGRRVDPHKGGLLGYSVAQKGVTHHGFLRGLRLAGSRLKRWGLRSYAVLVLSNP